MRLLVLSTYCQISYGRMFPVSGTIAGWESLKAKRLSPPPLEMTLSWRQYKCYLRQQWDAWFINFCRPDVTFVPKNDCLNHSFCRKVHIAIIPMMVYLHKKVFIIISDCLMTRLSQFWGLWHVSGGTARERLSLHWAAVSRLRIWVQCGHVGRSGNTADHTAFRQHYHLFFPLTMKMSVKLSVRDLPPLVLINCESFSSAHFWLLQKVSETRQELANF